MPLSATEQSSEPPEPPELPFEAPHSRRRIAARLLAALAVAALAWSANLIWLDDSPAQDRHGAKVRAFDKESALMGREMTARVVIPKGAQGHKGRSMVIFLHGRGEGPRTYLTEEMFEALADLRRRAPVIAFPSGGNASYWHDRDSGPWASYVLKELIPKLVERFRVDPERIAIGGISMGGFGAYNIARLAPGRFCAVGGHSPAIWQSAGATADGAFDDAEDFARNDVIAAAGSLPDPYEGTALWLDAGDHDPFLAADHALVDALREAGNNPHTSYPEGRHDPSYWNRRFSDYLPFYSRSLRNCEVELGARGSGSGLTSGRREGDAGAGNAGAGDGPGPRREKARSKRPSRDER